MFNISGEKLISRLFEIACLGLLVRAIAVGSDIGGAIAIVSIVISICYKQWLLKEKLSDRQILLDRIEELDKRLDSKINDVASKIQAVSMDRSIKRVNNTYEQAPQTDAVSGITKRFF